MNRTTIVAALPKVTSVLGGLALVVGIPFLGFLLLTVSAMINLIAAFKSKKKGDSVFFITWATFNTYFASTGH